MIQLRNLTLARGAQPLVENASLQLHPGWKIGLTGANGCGKSSFFALMRGELHADQGDLELPAAWAIAHVSQDTPALPDAALEFTLDGDTELRDIERQLVEAEAQHEGERIALLHGRLQDIGGYAAKARAAELLHGLGFTDADFLRPVADFSGGWRVRLNLAKALMARSDLLLLDEPTNHLDLDAVLWLEGWLKSYPGTLLMISHDRDFLDAVVGQILHIESRRMTLYTGNYSACERARAAHLAAQQSMYEKQQREAAALHAFIDRFRAKASKARQAQSRIKALARMEEIALAHVDTPFTFRFAEPAGMSDPLLQLDLASVGYGNSAILERLALTLRPGGRVGLLGRNGAGKSTLVKLLAGELKAMSGERREGRNLKIGYFAQHQVEQLRPDESPLQHLVRAEPMTREQELRDYLGGFDFRGDMVSAPCGRFSGGEKARLVLSLLIRQRPNLLLLDEPTNHLDLEMREALTLALQETEAAVVVVSHDRHLLRTTCDELWLVADGKAVPFDGDLDDYAAWLAKQRSADRAAEPEKAAGKEARQAARQASDAEKRSAVAARRSLQKEIDKLDRQLAQWHEEKSAVAERLADPALYAGSAKEVITDLQKRDAELATLIETAEMRWLEAQEALESGVKHRAGEWLMATGQAGHAYEVTFAAPPDLAELRAMWLDLEARAPTTRFFNSWSWIGHWLAMLPPGMEKRLLAARADGQWVGLGLLVCNTRKIGPLPFCRRWHLHECGNAAFDPWIEHNDFLIDADHGDALRAALVAAWADAVGDAEELHLPGLRGCAWPQQVSGGLLRRDDSQPAYSIALEAVRNHDMDYTQVVAGSKRRLIRRSIKEYQTLGPLSVSVAQDAKQALTYFDRLVQLHSQRWSEGRRCSTFDKAPSLALHRRVIADRIGHGEIQLLRVAAGDADIGYLYNFIHGQRVYYYQSGFDYTLLAKHGRPGFVTHALAIQHNAALGFDLYDLMAGDAEYKAALATAEETMTWSTWCKPALRFRCEHQLRRLKRAK